MFWSEQLTSFSSSVFIIWKTVYIDQDKTSTQKRRVVVNIQRLNKISVTDIYLLSLQSDITAAVLRCSYILTVDVTDFFHQWKVQSEKRHKLTVVSHQGQKHYNITAMRYKNSPLYTQCQMNKMLQNNHHFIKAFVNDIIIFSKTLKEHLKHLCMTFSLFNQYELIMNRKKSFLKYSIIILLRQHVDELRMTTSEEKIAAILNLWFPETLKDLETYLRLTEWLHNYISMYTQVIASLQKLKTLLLKSSPKGKNVRKSFTKVKDIILTQLEKDSFKALQEHFWKPSFLIHFDLKWWLYVNIDASKWYGFRVIVYHVKNDSEGEVPHNFIELIMFISKVLNRAERNYWSTELKVTCLMWIMKKIRHMMKSVIEPMIIFTDHSVTINIIRQIKLVSSVTDKLNLQLVKALQYLSQFDLNVWYKSERKNLVPDTLLRLVARIEKHDAKTQRTLDEIFAFNCILVKLSDKFKNELKKAYMKDKHWTKVLSLLPDDESPELFKGMSFIRINELLYFVENDDKQRLCVSKLMKKKIFRLGHNDRSHAEFHQCYEHISEVIYIRKLMRHLQKYIEYCLTCQVC